MAQKDLIETLFGYSENTNLITKAMVIPILDELFPSLEYQGILGIGAEAVVIKCREMNSHVFCAVKIASPRFLRKEYVRERGIWGGNRVETKNIPRERFLNGVTIQKMASNLYLEDRDFPLVVPGNILLKTDPWLCFRMEFIDGIPLLRFLAERKNFRLSMSLYESLLVGIDKLHDVGIIHRDIKPENILVTGVSAQNPKLALLDWTQTKLIGNNTSYTLPGTQMGTVPYSSEKMTIQADAGNASYEDDIVCLAVMLYEFCTFRKVPRPKEDVVNNLENRLEYLELLKTSIHPYLHTVFEYGCKVEENQRYKKIKPLLDNFRECLKQAGFFQLADEGWELNLAKMQNKLMGMIDQIKMMDARIKSIESFLERLYNILKS